MPFFAHVSLILAPDRSKLSKHQGATSVGQEVVALLKEGSDLVADADKALLQLLSYPSHSTAGVRRLVLQQRRSHHHFLDCRWHPRRTSLPELARQDEAGVLEVKDPQPLCLDFRTSIAVSSHGSFHQSDDNIKDSNFPM